MMKPPVSENSKERESSDALAAARREEIVDACAQLYEEMPFKDVTILKIGEKTSFTRTSVYNYFRTKEEIFLALLEREYRTWTKELDALAEAEFAPKEFPARFSELLERRRCMLKLLSMNLYDMEAGSRMEELTAFKRTYGKSMQAVRRCLKAHTHATDEEAEEFLYALYPFLFGLYPYAEVTTKQKEAMALAEVPYRRCTIAELARSLVEKLVFSFKGE